jgi:hypothetical protein
MINDRRLKQTALRYTVAKYWFPQIELLVQTSRSASRRAFDITDIDVFGAVPDEFSGYRTILFDCKSGGRESPITRAFWLKGLMEHLLASRGICILKEDKMIPLDHHETAANLNVSLMTISEFDIFAKATDGELPEGVSHLVDIDKWEAYFNLAQKYQNLQPAIEFSRSKFWLFSDPGDACRNVIALLRRLRGELDPSRKEHLVLFGDILSLFLYALAQVGHSLFKAYLQPASRNALDSVLLPYIYGGRENYAFMNQLNAAIPRRMSNAANTDLTLPEWDLFLHLTRSILDSPMQALYAPLLAREVAWSFFENNGSLAFAQTIAHQKRHTGKFCLQATRYVVSAAKLPPEFGQYFQDVFLNIQSIPMSEATETQIKLPISN